MRFELMLPIEIEHDWEQIGALLSPAIRRDEQRQAIDVYRDLMSGDMALFQVDLPMAKGIAVVEFADGVCWIVYIAGKITALPVAWRGRVRVLMSYFEGIARAHGCKEMRIEGRDWGSIFPEWERMGERPDRNELRKAL